MKPILPGSTIGFLGGGQLARMSGIAARTLGYNVNVFDPDPNCSSAAIADKVITATFSDVNAGLAFAKQCDVLTLDTEQIDASLAQAVSQHTPLRPGPCVLELIQHKGQQKTWLAEKGFPVGSFVYAQNKEELEQALNKFLLTEKTIARVKACRGGYDGKAQWRIDEMPDQEQLSTLWSQAGAYGCIIEKEIDLDVEMSALVARNANNDIMVHPLSRNWHTDNILDICVIPANLASNIEEKTISIAQKLAEQLTLEGIMAVEFFLSKQGEVLINELAPRPHNTFHTTMQNCITSQFEQHIRAICNLPLGNTRVIRPTALANLLGDNWIDGTPNGLSDVLSTQEIQVHLYGKKARPKRKIGHLLASATSPEVAVEAARQARKKL